MAFDPFAQQQEELPQTMNLNDLPDAADFGPDPESVLTKAAKGFGLTLTSGRRTPARNKAVGGAANSEHLLGAGWDFAGPPAAMKAFTEHLHTTYGKNLNELYHDPVGGWKGGEDIGPVGDHADHVHVSAFPTLNINDLPEAEELVVAAPVAELVQQTPVEAAAPAGAGATSPFAPFVINLSEFQAGQPMTVEAISSKIANSLGFTPEEAGAYLQASGKNPFYEITQGVDEPTAMQRLLKFADPNTGQIAIPALSNDVRQRAESWLKDFRGQREAQALSEYLEGLKSIQPEYRMDAAKEIARERPLTNEERAILLPGPTHPYAQIADKLGEGIATLAEGSSTGIGNVLTYLGETLGSVPNIPGLTSEGSREMGRDISGAGSELTERAETTGRAYGLPEGMPADVIRGAGSSLPFFALGAAGAPGRLGVGVLGWAMNAGQIYDEAIKSGLPHDKALMAAHIGGPVGLLEMWGIGGTLDRAARGAMINGFIRTVLSEAGEEATQEATQQVFNNLIAKGFYDPKRGVLQGVGYSALIAGITGGLMGGGTHVITGQETRPRPIAQGPREAAARGAGFEVVGESPQESAQSGADIRGRRQLEAELAQRGLTPEQIAQLTGAPVAPAAAPAPVVAQPAPREGAIVGEPQTKGFEVTPMPGEAFPPTAPQRPAKLADVEQGRLAEMGLTEDEIARTSPQRAMEMAEGDAEYKALQARERFRQEQAARTDFEITGEQGEPSRPEHIRFQPSQEPPPATPSPRTIYIRNPSTGVLKRYTFDQNAGENGMRLIDSVTGKGRLVDRTDPNLVIPKEQGRVVYSTHGSTYGEPLEVIRKLKNGRLEVRGEDGQARVYGADGYSETQPSERRSVSYGGKDGQARAQAALDRMRETNPSIEGEVRPEGNGFKAYWRTPEMPRAALPAAPSMSAPENLSKDEVEVRGNPDEEARRRTEAPYLTGTPNEMLAPAGVTGRRLAPEIESPPGLLERNKQVQREISETFLTHGVSEPAEIAEGMRLSREAAGQRFAERRQREQGPPSGIERRQSEQPVSAADQIVGNRTYKPEELPEVRRRLNEAGVPIQEQVDALNKAGAELKSPSDLFARSRAQEMAAQGVTLPTLEHKQKRYGTVTVIGRLTGEHKLLALDKDGNAFWTQDPTGLLGNASIRKYSAETARSIERLPEISPEDVGSLGGAFPHPKAVQAVAKGLGKPWATIEDVPDEYVKANWPAHYQNRLLADTTGTEGVETSELAKRMAENIELGGRSTDSPLIMKWRKDIQSKPTAQMLGDPSVMPKTVAIIAHDLWHNGVDLVKATNDLVEKFGDVVRPYVRRFWDAFQGNEANLGNIQRDTPLGQAIVRLTQAVRDDQLELALYHIDKGANTEIAFQHKMREVYGPEIGESRIRRIWKEAQEYVSPSTLSPREIKQAKSVLDKLTRGDSRIGVPANIQTPEDLAMARRNWIMATRQGEASRYWYERSSQAILDMFGGDKKNAEKFTQLLAIYSPNNAVLNNTYNALRAWYQYQNGQPIKGGQFDLGDENATRLLYDGLNWEGRKTNNFYLNLMSRIDPTALPPEIAEQAGLEKGPDRAVTVDKWMMRALGYDAESPSKAQYEFAANEIRRIADGLGWKPQQVQAAMWTAARAKSALAEAREVPTGKVGKKVAKLADSSPGLFLTAPASAPLSILTSNDIDFKDTIAQTLGQVSFETAPGSPDYLPGYRNATPDQKEEYHVAMRDAIREPAEQIARELGLAITSEFHAPGVYQGIVTPGTQIEIPMPPAQQTRGGKQVEGAKGTVDEAIKLRLDAYAAWLGQSLKQNSVAWTRPFFGATGGNVANQNAMDLNIGRPLSMTEAVELERVLSSSGHPTAVVSTKTGAWLLNLSEGATIDKPRSLFEAAEPERGPVDNKAFHQATLKAIGRLPWNFEAKLKTFRKDGYEIGSQDYQSRISAVGRPDIFGTGDSVANASTRRVYEDFSRRYGWDKPEQPGAGTVGATPGEANAGATEEVGSAPGRDVRDIVHYGRAGLTELNPDARGAGNTGNEGGEGKRRQRYPDRYVNRRYIGYGDYQKEAGTGAATYAGSIDFSTLYNSETDPLHLVDIAARVARSRNRGDIATEMERLVKEHGYLGYYNDTKQTAAIFHRIPLNAHVDEAAFAKSAPEYQRRNPAMVRVVHDFAPEIDQIPSEYFQQKPLDAEQQKAGNERAKAYEALKDDNLSDPNVRRAYDALVAKTKEQYQALEAQGIKAEPWTQEGQPYKNSTEMQEDLRRNKHLYYFPTEGGFGTEHEASKNHPLLQDSGLKAADGTPMLNNDAFRVIHDAIAHGAYGTQFGPAGEEATWRAHMATIDDPWARWALTTETRGQNSWVNFRDEYFKGGKALKPGEEGYVAPPDRPFAPQKVDLMDPAFMLTGDAIVDVPVLNDPDFQYLSKDETKAEVVPIDRQKIREEVIAAGGTADLADQMEAAMREGGERGPKSPKLPNGLALDRFYDHELHQGLPDGTRIPVRRLSYETASAIHDIDIQPDGTRRYKTNGKIVEPNRIHRAIIDQYGLPSVGETVPANQLPAEARGPRASSEKPSGSQMIGVFKGDKLVGTASLSKDADPDAWVKENYGKGYDHGPLSMETQRNIELGGKHDDHPKIIQFRKQIGGKTRLTTGLDPEQAFKSAMVLGYDLYRHTKDFADWSKVMIKKAGQLVKPLLKEVFAEMSPLHYQSERAVAQEKLGPELEESLRDRGASVSSLDDTLYLLSDGTKIGHRTKQGKAMISGSYHEEFNNGVSTSIDHAYWYNPGEGTHNLVKNGIVRVSTPGKEGHYGIDFARPLTEGQFSALAAGLQDAKSIAIQVGDPGFHIIDREDDVSIPAERNVVFNTTLTNPSRLEIARALREGNTAAEGYQRLASRERNIELGGREDDHPDIVRYRNEIGGQSGKLNIGADPIVGLKSAVVLGYDTYRAVKDFGAWSKEMIAKAGDAVRPILKDLFTQVQAFHGQGAEFYSPLQKTVEAKMGAKMAPVELRRMLEGQGVSKEEMIWTGMDDLLKDRAQKGQTLTKQEVNDHLAKNAIKVEEIVAGGKSKLQWESVNEKGEASPYLEEGPNGEQYYTTEADSRSASIRRATAPDGTQLYIIPPSPDSQTQRAIKELEKERDQLWEKREEIRRSRGVEPYDEQELYEDALGRVDAKLDNAEESLDRMREAGSDFRVMTEPPITELPAGFELKPGTDWYPGTDKKHWLVVAPANELVPNSWREDKMAKAFASEGDRVYGFQYPAKEAALDAVLGDLNETRTFSRHPDLESAEGAIETRLGDSAEAKYAQYVTEGGSGYKEFRMSLPEVTYRDLQAQLDVVNGKMSRTNDKARIAELTEEGKKLQQRIKNPGRENYQSGHFPEKNLVVHTRTTDREVPAIELEESHPELAKRLEEEGRDARVLHLEEVQSDYGQTGRKKGVRSEGDNRKFDDKYQELEQAREAFHKEENRTAKEFGYDSTEALLKESKRRFPDDSTARNQWWSEQKGTLNKRREVDEAYWGARQRVHDLEKEVQEANPVGKIPPAPFIGNTEDWTSLALKRMIRYAAENGYDLVTWSLASEQFKRWGSERIDWEKDKTEGSAYDKPKSFWRVAGQEQYRGNAGGVDIEGEAARRGVLAKASQVVTEKADLRALLADVMKRERSQYSESLWEKHLDDLTDKTWEKMQAQPSGTVMPRKEGFEGYYDRMLPNYVAKYGKKFGAKVGQVEIPVATIATSRGGTEYEYDEMDAARRTNPTLPSESFRSRTIPVNALEITPEMQRSVTAEGQPILGSEPRFLAEARARVRQAMVGSVSSANPISLLIDMGLMTGHDVYKATKTFAGWSNQMRKRLGKEIEPHLENLWRVIKGSMEVDVNKPETLKGQGGFLGITRQPPRPKASGAPAAYTMNGEAISTIRKASLLLSPKTHFRNVVGTGVFQGVEELARIPGSALDMVAGAIIGQRGLTGPSVRAVSKAGYEAATKGVREALDILKQGTPANNPAQLHEELDTGFPVLDKAVNGVFRLLSAEDRVQKVYAMRRSLEGRAKAIALNEKKQGILRGSVQARADAIVAAPSASLIAETIIDADIATFNNDNVISTAIAKGRAELRKTGGDAGKVVNFTIDTLMPFDRTPTNIIARMLEYTPGGIVYGGSKMAYRTAAAKIAGKAFTSQEQLQFSRTFGRGVTGTALIALGYALGGAGAAMPMYDDDPKKAKENRANKEAGRNPMSVRIGNKWLTIGSFSPIANLIAIGATLEKNDSEGKTPLGSALMTFGKATMEQPLLETTSELAKAGQSERRLASFGGRLAGSFVPGGGLTRDIATATDDRARKQSGFKGQLFGGIPGLRRTLPEDVGAPHSRWWAIDPFRTTTDSGAPPADLKQRTESKVVEALKKGDRESAKKAYESGVKGGVLAPEDTSTVNRLKDKAKMNDLQYKVKHGMDLEEALDQFISGTEEERRQIAPLIMEKQENYLKQVEGGRVASRKVESVKQKVERAKALGIKEMRP